MDISVDQNTGLLTEALEFLMTNFHDHIGLFARLIDCYCFVSIQLFTVVFQ